MAAEILVASPHPAFGELVRLSLEEEGDQYHIRLVMSPAETQAALSRAPYDLLILDSDLRGQPFVQFVQTLLQIRPHIKLIVIPPENNPAHPSLAGLRADGFINKPFYQPDLIELVRSLLAQTSVPPTVVPVVAVPPAEDAAPPKPAPEPPTDLPWLHTGDQAAKILEAALQQSSAFGAAIFNPAEIVLSGGQISPAAAQEIFSALARHWKWGEQTDLARFMHVETSGSDFLIYATTLTRSLALALEYEVSTPITRIRTQTAKLVRWLKSPPALTEPLPLPSVPSPFAEAIELPANLQPNPEPVDLPLPPEFAQSGEEEVDTEMQPINLGELLAGAPPPDPVRVPVDAPLDWIPENAPGEHDANLPEFTFPWEQDPSYLQTPSAPVPASSEVPTQPAPIVTTAVGVPNQPSPPVQTVTPDMTPLVCVFIPAAARHILAADLAEKLSLFVPTICQAANWRVGGIAIRPDYLECLIYLPEDTMPDNAAELLRARTGERIFEAFPALRLPGGSGEFWSDEFLALVDPQPGSAQEIRAFVRRVRQEQQISA